MKTKKLCVLLLKISLLIAFTGNAYSLDLYDTLTDGFMGLVDENEGLTSFGSLNITSGGREESLGSAFTGLADDIGFFDYNPAASAILEKTEIAFFHNSWISDSALESLAATIRFGNLGLGAKLKCFYVPFSEYNIFGERVSSNYYSETTAIFNIAYNFFAGYYFKGLTVGANIKAAWRSIPDYTDNDTNAIIEGSGLAQSALGLIGDLGIMLRFNLMKLYASRDANLRIGLSLLNAGVAFTGYGSNTGVILDDPLPTTISAGISYRFIKPLAFTAEFRQPLNLRNIEKSGKWSAGAGIDVNITDFMEIMAGFRIKGGNPRFSLGSEFVISRLIMDINYTFDLTSTLNPVNHFSLSARLDLGDRGRAEMQALVDSFYAEGLSHYAEGDFDAAIESWEKSLALDKGFDPARAGIKAIRNSRQLYERVLDIQTLD